MLSKKINQIVILVALAAIAAFSGCVKGDYDQAPLLQKFQIDSGDTLVSIAKLKTLHNANSTLIDTVKNNWVIMGKIISNDSCGNTYKYITIQDTSGGIAIGIDNGDLYLKYKLGQRVYVKCKGLMIGGQIFSLSGAHLTATQLGFKEGLAIGTIPDAFKTNYIFRDSFAGTVPSPKEFTAWNQLTSENIGTLIKMKNIQFSPATDNFGPIFNLNNVAPVRDLVDSTGIINSLYVSPYSCFAKDSIPTVKCNITGILSTYDGGYQLVPRTKNDISLIAN